jgi:hypothetical protein
MDLHHSNFLPFLWFCTFTSSIILLFVMQFLPISDLLPPNFLLGWILIVVLPGPVHSKNVLLLERWWLCLMIISLAWMNWLLKTFMTGLSDGLWLTQASKVNTGKRSWKRSSTHVYISRLIRVLQIPESRDSLPLHLNQLRPHDILSQGVFMTINNFNGNRNGLNGATPSRAIVNMTDKNSNQRQRLHQDQPQTPSGVYNSQKQVNLAFNFQWFIIF